MYICVYECMYVCECMCVCVYVSVRVDVCVDICVDICVYVCEYMCVDICECMRVCMCECICGCACLYLSCPGNFSFPLRFSILNFSSIYVLPFTPPPPTAQGLGRRIILEMFVCVWDRGGGADILFTHAI